MFTLLCGSDSCLDYGPLDQYCCSSADFPSQPCAHPSVEFLCTSLVVTGTAQNFILLDGNENPNMPTSAVFHPHWLFVPLEIVGNPWLQTGHAGATNLAEGLLLPAALGRGAAEMAKNLRDLACKEPEPCSPGLKGFLLNSWGFYTVVFWSNFLCSLIFL